MSSIGTSTPCSAKTSRAVATMRCRLRSASTRSPALSAVRGAGVEVMQITVRQLEATVHLSAIVGYLVEMSFHFFGRRYEMRAVVVAEQGAAPALAEVPTPQPGAGEVLVRVQASSVNGFDLSVAAGHVAGMMEHRYP